MTNLSRINIGVDKSVYVFNNSIKIILIIYYYFRALWGRKGVARSVRV